MTFAAYMEHALYDPEHGYYATTARRSGRGGDFFTSVDVGPLFGEMIAAQLDEMWALLRAAGATEFHLIEAAAGNGRLTRDIVAAAADHHPDLHAHLRISLVERSPAARAAQRETMRETAAFESLAELPAPGTVTGAIVANELLDALPVHAVTMTHGGLREICVAERDGTLVEIDLPPSSPELGEYLERVGVPLPVGARAEIGLDAERWMRTAAACLHRGFLLLFDYGHEAPQLLSPPHDRGTLMAYHAHAAHPDGVLREPGARDLTAHVNLTAVRRAAEAAGLETIGIVDQTYFLTGLGVAARLGDGADARMVTRRLAAKTLLMPGGLGSTMKAMAFAKELGRPPLRGLSFGRLT